MTQTQDRDGPSGAPVAALRAGGVAPIGIERTYPQNALVVSKTDLQGRITYANKTFLDVTVGVGSQFLGAPHNIIRHPDMPRAIFALIWETIQDGREIFAYVQNLALDGYHYWVFTHVAPTFGAHGDIIGYHSNRRWPDRDAIAAATPLYAHLRAIEQRHPTSRAAAAAGLHGLRDWLDERDTNYEDWVWSITAPEA